MTIINIIDGVRDWLNTEVCEQYSAFKKPPETGEADAQIYDYELVQPVAYSFHPPIDCKFPSLTVQFDDGTIEKFAHNGEYNINILFATWSPGLHDGENFTISQEGWRDVFNLIDYTLRKLINTNIINEKIRIKHENSIKVKTISDKGVLANYYPYWAGILSFTVTDAPISTGKDLDI